MNQKHRNIEQLPRDQRGSYCVEKEYFEELNHRIIKYAELNPTPQSVNQSTLYRLPHDNLNIRRMVVSFVAVAAMVAVLIFVGTPQREVFNESDDDYMMMSLYNISAEEIYQYQNQSLESTPEERAIYAEVAMDYLDIYGLNLIEVETE